MSDLISRQAAIDALAKAMPSLTTPDGSGAFDHDIQIADEAFVDAMQIIQELPSAQPKQTDCEYCHEDSDGYVRPLEKNCHAFVRYGINGWEIGLKAKGWSGSAKIKYCPMCGRELKHG